MKRLNGWFYVGSVIAVFVLFIAVTILGVTASARRSDWVFLVGVIIWTLLLYLVVVMSVLIYKMWAAIQDGHARTTPARALGFCFIPIFNLYWVFQAFPGFATDYNRMVERYGLTLRRLPRSLFITYAVLCLASFLPLVGIVAMLGNVLLTPVMVGRICGAVNALPEADRLAEMKAADDGTTPAVTSPPGMSAAAIVGIVAAVAFGMFIVIGIVAAIAIPSFVHAKEKARLQGTANLMQDLSRGMIAYYTDHGYLPPQQGDFTPGTPLYAALVPDYWPSPRPDDMWGNPLKVYTGQACTGVYGMGQCEADDFFVISWGRDGEEETWYFDPADHWAGVHRDGGMELYEHDLVMFNGQWIRRPDGNIR